MKRLSSSQKSQIDFTRDYQPRRLGIKIPERMIVLEYLIPSTGKRFHHYMKLAKYHQNIELQPLQDFEVQKVVTEVIKEHQDYFQTYITSEQIKQLVTKISKAVKPATHDRSDNELDDSTLRNSKTSVAQSAFKK